ncbi:MAG: hypothetical protein JW725_02205 [Candidatus Babeliaceae bacterium]|nr:hypothetical protein [Candidatus Babeliaceae bacterium]
MTLAIVRAAWMANAKCVAETLTWYVVTAIAATKAAALTVIAPLENANTNATLKTRGAAMVHA